MATFSLTCLYVPNSQVSGYRTIGPLIWILSSYKHDYSMFMINTSRGFTMCASQGTLLVIYGRPGLFRLQLEEVCNVVHLLNAFSSPRLI